MTFSWDSQSTLLVTSDLNINPLHVIHQFSVLQWKWNPPDRRRNVLVTKGLKVESSRLGRNVLRMKRFKGRVLLPVILQYECYLMKDVTSLYISVDGSPSNSLFPVIHWRQGCLLSTKLSETLSNSNSIDRRINSCGLQITLTVTIVL